MKIGFISAFSPHDRRASSGTCYKMAKELEHVGELKWLPLQTPKLYRFLELIQKVFFRYFRGGKNYQFSYTHWGAKLLARNFQTELIDDCDLLVAFWCGAILGGINTKNKPVIYFSDATFSSMINYYEPFSKLPEFNIRQGNAIEKRSLDKANVIVVSSDWCAHSVKDDFNQDPEKIHVVEFGANIDKKDIIPHKSSYNKQHLDILFLGVNWDRKGGPEAVDATRWLNENGISATLHIVGIRNLSMKIQSLPFINYVGFLNKNIKQEYNKLVNIITQCHLLLLPTKAECSAIAFAEASANGLPIFTYRTGGVPNYVINGVNGYMLPLGSTGDDFGKKIKECATSGELEILSKKAPSIYTQKLNWEEWRHKIEKIIESLAI